MQLSIADPLSGSHPITRPRSHAVGCGIAYQWRVSLRARLRPCRPPGSGRQQFGGPNGLLQVQRS